MQFMLTESEGFSRSGSQFNAPEERCMFEEPEKQASDANLIIVQEDAWSLTKSSESILSSNKDAEEEKQYVSEQSFR